MNRLTAAQVWYVAKVYPETVTDAEAREPFAREVTTEADRSYWEVAASVLNRLGSDNCVPDARCTCAEVQFHRMRTACPVHDPRIPIEQDIVMPVIEQEFEKIRAENERLLARYNRANNYAAELEAENERLRAAVETAAAMVNQADPDLSAALLKLLGRDKCR